MSASSRGNTVSYVSPATKIAAAYSPDQFLIDVRRAARTMRTCEIGKIYFAKYAFPTEAARAFCKKNQIFPLSRKHSTYLPPRQAIGERALSKVFCAKALKPWGEP